MLAQLVDRIVISLLWQVGTAGRDRDTAARLIQQG